MAQLAVVAAMFHLFTHAFFKALLFLASGSVMHAMGGVIDMRRFGGLRHRLPITCWTFAVGGLALAGIFPLAGFWSKDEILAALKLAAHASGRTARRRLSGDLLGRRPHRLPDRLLHRPRLLPDLLRAREAPEPRRSRGRNDRSTCPGHELDPHRPSGLPEPTPGATDEPVPQTPATGTGHDDHFGHESPPIMWIPLVVLAAGAVLVGLIFGPTGLFEHHLIGKTPGFEALGHAEHATDWLSIVLGTIVGLLGLALSYWMYAAPNSCRGTGRAARAALSGVVRQVQDRRVLRGDRRPATWLLAAIARVVDIRIVDGLVRLVAWVPRFVGRDVLGPFQNGLIQFYAAVTALGVAGLLLILLLVVRPRRGIMPDADLLVITVLLPLVGSIVLMLR